MNELIKISNSVINGAEVNSVNLRDLHTQLKSKRQFADFAKARLSRFVENEDYICISQKSEIGNKPLIQYIVTIDTAKMIAMMENNEAGDSIRKYFVSMEKKALHVTPQNFTMKAIAEMANSFLSVEQDIAEVKADVSSLKNTSALTATDCFNYQKAVKFKVDSIIAKYPTVSKGVLFSQIHGKVKEVYKVASYKDLPHFKINELLNLVNALDVRVA